MKINFNEYKKLYETSFGTGHSDSQLLNYAIRELSLPILDNLHHIDLPNVLPQDYGVGGIIYMPSGLYTFTNAVIINRPGITIEGDNPGYYNNYHTQQQFGTLISLEGKTEPIDGFVITPSYISPDATSAKKVGNTLPIRTIIKNLRFGGSNGRNAISIYSTSMFLIENVSIYQMQHNGIYITDGLYNVKYEDLVYNDPTTPTIFKEHAFYITDDWRIMNCEIYGSGMHGIYIQDVRHNTSAGMCENLVATGNHHYALVDQSVNGNTYINCHFEKNGEYIDPVHGYGKKNNQRFFTKTDDLTETSGLNNFYYKDKIEWHTISSKGIIVNTISYPLEKIRMGGEILIDNDGSPCTFIGCYIESDAIEPFVVKRHFDSGLYTLSFDDTFTGGDNVTVIGGVMSGKTRTSNIERIGSGNSKLQFQDFDRSEPIDLRNIKVEIPNVTASSTQLKDSRFRAIQFKYVGEIKKNEGSTSNQENVPTADHSRPPFRPHYDLYEANTTLNNFTWNLERFVDEHFINAGVKVKYLFKDQNYPLTNNSERYSDFSRTWAICQEGNDFKNPVIPFGWTDESHLSGSGHFFFGSKEIANQQTYFTCRLDITQKVNDTMLDNLYASSPFLKPHFSIEINAQKYIDKPEGGGVYIPWLDTARNQDNKKVFDKLKKVNGQFSIQIINNADNGQALSDGFYSFYKELTVGAFLIDYSQGSFIATVIMPNPYTNNTQIPPPVAGNKIFLIAHFEKWVNWAEETDSY